MNPLISLQEETEREFTEKFGTLRFRGVVNGAILAFIHERERLAYTRGREDLLKTLEQHNTGGEKILIVDRNVLL